MIRVQPPARIWRGEAGLKKMLPLALAPLLALAPAGAAPAPGIPQPPDELAAIPVYLAVDAGSRQVLAAREADSPFLPASVTKTMTAWVAFELMAQGKLRPDQRFTVRPETARTWHGRGTGLQLNSGEQVTVDALLRGITTVSANDAAVVLAEGAAGSLGSWTALMNAEARELGMSRSHFATPNGWPDFGATRVTAADLIRLGEALVERHPALYRRYFGHKSLTWNGITQQNHDPTLGVVAGADGIKTGHTAESGYSFLGTAARAGRRVMIVIGGARSEEQRAQAARALLEWGFAAWDTKPLFASGRRIGTALVQGGNARRVGLVAAHDVALTVPHGSRAEPSLMIRYRGPLRAPFAKGAELARLEVRVPGQPTAQVPLLAENSVAKAGPFDRLLNGVAGLLR
jgi:D-alanyl-D-alanine carboxypeptidase (penicillin-binding protein 5/6)